MARFASLKPQGKVYLMNDKPKALPHDQLSTIMVVGGYKVKKGDELRTCACCRAGIRNVVVVQDVDLPDAKWELGKDCADTHATLSFGIPGRRAQTTNRRFVSHELARSLRAG